MTNRTGAILIAAASTSVLAVALYANSALFPRVEVARNTQTVTHTTDDPKPEAPTGIGGGCKSKCSGGSSGGGGIIRIGG